MKKLVVFFGFLSTSLFSMNPGTAGAFTGASLGATIGTSVGTFIVVDKASTNPLFLLKSSEEKVATLVKDGGVFTVAGYTAVGASAGALVGTVGTAFVYGTVKTLSALGRGDNIILNGAFVTGGLAATKVLFSVLSKKDTVEEE